MKRQRKTTEVLDWEELEGAPNTHGAFSFLRPQGTIINIEEHRQQETAASPDAEVNIQTKTSTVDDLSSVERHLALRRPYKVHRCYRAQDAHSHGENQLYAALWHAGVPDGPETKRVIMGWDRMARQAGMSDKAAKRNLKQLRDKLAVELLEVENSATRTGRTYRIYSFRAILERRNAAGLHFVVRDKGVRFVQAADIESAGNIDEGEVTNKTSTVDRTSTVDKTTTGTVDKTSRDTVDKTSTPLGSSLGSKDRKTTTTGEDLTPIVNALSSYAVADEDAAKRIMLGSRAMCESVSVDEIVSVIHLKAQTIIRNRSINNPLGLLVRAVPQCFEGSGILQLRAHWAAEHERALLIERERELREQELAELFERERIRCEETLADPESTEAQRAAATRSLSQLSSL